MNLHIYGQQSEHDDVTIIGDAKALTALKEAIELALQDKKVRVSHFFTNDGEGYSVNIIKKSDLSDMPVPYTADYAEEKNPEKWKVFQQEVYDVEIIDVCN